MTGSVPPKVSVCIPVYNGAAYIAEAIESVLAQSYEDFHLIVCDNCSTDNTEEIVRSYKDSRLTYVRNAENLGLVGNANRCLELSDGEYVCIFHHDDVMLPDNLERKVHLLDEHPEVGIVHSNLILIDPEGGIIAQNIWNEDSRRDYIEKGITVFQRYLSYLSQGRGAIIFIGSVLARRSCYEHLGGFSPELPHCNDSEMWMRMLLFYNAACIGTPLVKYRVHLESTSSNWDRKSIHYLKEHYLAAMMIFDSYNDHIPYADNLKHQISLSIGEHALNLACGTLVNGDFATGRKFIKEAINMSPWIIRKAIFWKAALGLTVGQSGIKLYQKIKNIL